MAQPPSSQTGSLTVILAGAGASKAVDASQFPTTVEFFNQLPSPITDHGYFKHTVELLRDKMGAAAAIDIEQVLWVVQELEGFLADLADGHSALGWFHRKQRILGPLRIDQNQVDANIVDNASRTHRYARQLVSDINRQVYEWYAEPPEPEKLEANWLALLRGLQSLSPRLEVFTTNYDLVLEAAAARLGETDPSTPRIDAGHRGAVQQHLDLGHWSRGPRGTLDPRPGGLLTKLHGSVDWSRKPGVEKIYVGGDPGFKGDHERHVILYPGFKGGALTEPFNLFHDHFANCLRVASRLVVIGFAFRDERISDLVERYLPETVPVVVIDPGELPHLPLEPGRAIHIPDGFKRESAELAIKVLSSPDVGKAFVDAAYSRDTKEPT